MCRPDVLGICISYSCVNLKIGFSKNEKFAKLPHLKPLLSTPSLTQHNLSDCRNLHVHLESVPYSACERKLTVMACRACPRWHSAYVCEEDHKTFGKGFCI